VAAAKVIIVLLPIITVLASVGALASGLPPMGVLTAVCVTWSGLLTLLVLGLMFG